LTVKHVHAKFQLSSSNTDGLRFFWQFFKKISEELLCEFYKKKKSNLSM
jgi:hypothetical protein